MYKRENIAEIKILLNPFTSDSEKTREQLRPAHPPASLRSFSQPQQGDAQGNALLIHVRFLALGLT